MHVVSRAAFVTTLRATGSEAHVEHLERQARERGVSLVGSGEMALHRRLGLPFISPNLREDEGEIEAARSGDLPADLVTAGDITGARSSGGSRL